MIDCTANVSVYLYYMPDFDFLLIAFRFGVNVIVNYLDNEGTIVLFLTYEFI